MKRPRNQYILFSQEMRPVVAAEYPNESGPQIMARIGKRWQMLSDEQVSGFGEQLKKNLGG